MLSMRTILSAILIVSCSAAQDDTEQSYLSPGEQTAEKPFHRLGKPSAHLKVENCRNMPDSMWGDTPGSCEDNGYVHKCTSCRALTDWFVKDPSTCTQSSTECYFKAEGEICTTSSQCPKPKAPGKPLLSLVQSVGGATAVKSHQSKWSNLGVEYDHAESFQPINSREPTENPAYVNVEWTPTADEAQQVIEAMIGTVWCSEYQHYRSDHGGSEAGIQHAEDFIWLYCGSGIYATNVERCSRGALALTSGQADIFDTDPLEATALAVRFTAGLAAALALIPSSAEPQALFRGASEPFGMIEHLEGLAGTSNSFTLPGLASTTTVKEHAISFMGKGPYRQQYGRAGKEGPEAVNVLYEFSTKQAKDVTSINAGEHEWILPPNREFKVFKTSKVAKNSKEYLHVWLLDA